MFEKIRENIKVILILIGVLVCVGMVTGYVVYKNQTSINESTKDLFSDSVNNEPSYTDLNGNPVSLEEYLGKVLVVNSWASWSPFSRDELKNLNDLSANYDKDKVVFLAINRKESREQAQRFVNTLPELKSLIIVIDTKDNFYTKVSGFAMPETTIYDQRGEITEQIHGLSKNENIKEIIDRLLIN